MAPRIPSAIFAAVLVAMAGLAGCATDADDPSAGQVVIPLLQPGPHGELFHLANATFDIVGNSNGVTTTVDGSGVDSSVTVELPPGLYTITLRDGWSLERSTDGGAIFEEVPALLGTPNPTTLRVLANVPQVLQFNFLIRSPDGTLQITLGVIPDPRELVGGVLVETATGTLAPYADPGNRSFDFGIFFSLVSLESVTAADGTKQHIYTAFPGQVLGPVTPPQSAVAIEFYNDHVGLLASSVVPELTAGFLQYTVGAKPDGTFELSGSLTNIGTLTLAPSPIDAILPTLDPDGFPHDGFFYDSGSPFTLTTQAGTMTGVLRVRHIVP
ncbi:MAG TPA: hypothetical protein VFT22_11620 [Kofleriaceae bacterium]|nr:hypothetical protein [Kofleriaceae bacterium]